MRLRKLAWPSRAKCADLLVYAFLNNLAVYFCNPAYQPLLTNH